MKCTLAIVSLLLAVCLAAGCGYHVAGRGDAALPKSIHVVQIPAIENKTSSYRIEQRLTAATIHEFLVRTNLKAVSTGDADAILTSKVLTLEAVPLLFTNIPATTTTQATTRATSMLITMKCEVTLTETNTQRVLYHTDNFVFRNQYEISTDIKSFFEEQDPALDRMAQDFAKRLVSAVTENY